MPIYDFSCSACQHEFELFVRGVEPPACPRCGSAIVSKLVSLPAKQGKTKIIVDKARRQAAKEGYFSNYAPSERPRRK